MTQESNSITLFVVDDHQLFRRGVIGELKEHFEIVGEAESIEEAIRNILGCRPSIVLVDVHMPDGGGLTVVERVRRERPQQKFLVLSVSDEPQDVVALIRAGARGYVTKTIGTEQLIEAIQRVADGDAVFSPRLAAFVLDAFTGAEAPITSAERSTPEGGQPDYPNDEIDILTAREQEVLKLVARGFLYKEIALRLSISHKTVEHHVGSVLRKLQLSNRSELTRWAVQRRIVKLKHDYRHD